MNQISSFPSPDGHQQLSFLHRPAAVNEAHPWLLVLMHGVGSNEDDLFALADFVPSAWHVLSLRGPFELGPGSHAWFEFSMAADGTRRIDRLQEAASRNAVAHSVLALGRELGVPPHRTVLGGFSQGGIMALSLLRTRPVLMQGAMVMHGRLLPEVDTLEGPPEALQGKALWVSHGQQDGVIPLASAQAIRDWATARPLALRYREFPGAHEIRLEELQAAMGWLDQLAG
jgi:phospholipase/carboxylesterase